MRSEQLDSDEIERIHQRIAAEGKFAVALEGSKHLSLPACLLSVSMSPFLSHRCDDKVEKCIHGYT